MSRRYGRFRHFARGGKLPELARQIYGQILKALETESRRRAG